MARVMGERAGQKGIEMQAAMNGRCICTLTGGGKTHRSISTIYTDRYTQFTTLLL
jgi:hypothetical protein